MGNPSSIVSKLAAVGKIDAMLGNITAERARLDRDLKAKLSTITKLTSARDHLGKILHDRKYQYQKEDKNLRDERQKVSDRKTALHSLNSRKLIEAAEREVESSQRLLDAREDALLKVLDEVEKLETEFNTLRDQAASEDAQLVAFRKESDDTLRTLQERQILREGERKEATKDIPPESLREYERVRGRYPSDALVSVKGGSCSGCFMQVAPQLLLQLSKGDTIVKCRGCGRILAPEPSEDSNIPKAS